MRPKGSSKTPGSGRKRGSLNKRTVLFRSVKESLDRKGFNPSDLLADVGLGRIRGKNADLRLRAACEALKYIQPQLTRVENTGMDGGAIQHGPIQLIIEYADLSGETSESSSSASESSSGGEEI